MKRLYVALFAIGLTFLSALTTPLARADASHARIVRLSLVQGDVRFTREFHKNSLEDPKAVWENAPLNLPIREGFALATDANSRAEVEFENGAMAFLSANTVVEFYDLSSYEGAHITRLILRQGSSIFYVHPADGDYFSVTGGDFSVEANGRTRFRMDNYDDGSAVNVEQGQINVLRKNDSKPLEKGQSYSININDGSAPAVGRMSEYDDFDKWVSGRIDAVATATAYSSQYVSSPDYTSGFADLYNYGSFYNVPGYGYGWQPYGVGPGWDPFAFGSWYSDPYLGWNFIGSAPWGWLPYHYGSWVFGPMGWMWMPLGFGFGGIGPMGGFYPYGFRYPLYRSVTGVWVHNGSSIGLVPANPGDKPGKTPLNLAHGIYTIQDNTLVASQASVAGENWAVTKNPPRTALVGTTLATATQPTRVSRTILSGNAGSRPVTISRDSSIVYDPGQHRFVNNNNPPKTSAEETKVAATTGAGNNPAIPDGSLHSVNPPGTAHGATPARPHISPPTPHISEPSYSAGGSNRGAGSGATASAGSSHGTSASGGHSSGGAVGGGHH